MFADFRRKIQFALRIRCKILTIEIQVRKIQVTVQILSCVACHITPQGVSHGESRFMGYRRLFMPYHGASA